MGAAFLYGGGGGAGVNFAVVGGTIAPTSPKENTLWINTAEDISGVVFASDQPTGTAGLIWIRTAAMSGAGFNAISGKAGGIDTTLAVYPVECKQYVSGTWVGKTLKVYSEEEWKDLTTYLYYKGNEYPTITGGWQRRNFAFAGNTVGVYPTMTKNAANIRAYITTAYESISGVCETVGLIDLTPCGKLAVHVTEKTNNNAYLLVYDSTGTLALPLDDCAISGTGVKEVDVSALSGSYHVAIGLSCYNSTTTVTIAFDEVYAI